MELWKKKHENGQWVEIEAAEAMANQLNIAAMNASGILLSNIANKPFDSNSEMASENYVKSSADGNSGNEANPIEGYSVMTSPSYRLHPGKVILFANNNIHSLSHQGYSFCFSFLTCKTFIPGDAFSSDLGCTLIVYED